MYCKNCGEHMNDNQAICLKCGVLTGDGNGFCENCGKPVAPHAIVCLNCGVAIESKAVNRSVDGKLGGYDKIAMALLCIFLGEFGIHNFILGENKKGIFKIVMTFCFFISIVFVLIDFVKILTDKYVIEPDKFV